MTEKQQLTAQNIQIQGVIDSFLKNAKLRKNGGTPSDHLAEDTLSAFVEGTLSERESKPVVAHLVECSFCLHITAELVRLDLDFAIDVKQSAAETAAPAKISDVLSGLLAKIFGGGDQAVFAHEEKKEKNGDAPEKP